MPRPKLPLIFADAASAADARAVDVRTVIGRPLLHILFCAVTLALAVSAGAGESKDEENKEEKNFAAAVAPILVDRCLACHGGDSVEGGYDISTLAGIWRPGDSAAKPVVTGDPANSELYRRLVTEDESELMPSGGPRLSVEELETIRNWIASGASTGPAGAAARLIDATLPQSHYLQPPDVYPRPLPVTAIAAATGHGPVVLGGYRELLLWRDADATSPERLAGFHVYISTIAMAAEDRIAIAHGTPGRQGDVTLARLTAAGLADRSTVLRDADVPAALAFSPAGDHLAVATLSGRLVVVNLMPPEDAKSDAAEPTVRLDFTPHADAILALAWSPDGSDIMTASRDRTARVIRLKDARVTSNYAAHDRAVHGVCQIRSGALTLDETGTLRLWAAGNRNALLSRPRVSDAVLGMQRFGNTVLVPRSDRVLRITVEHVEQDDGTDKDGKPKKKKVPRWKDLPPLQIDSADAIVSLAVAVDGAVLAGTHSGRLYRWLQGSAAKSPVSEEPLVALPR